MIPAWLADVIRYTDVSLCLALMVACGWAIALGDHWDQRVRFGIFGAFAFTLTGGHLSTLGHAGTWRLAALVPIVLVALVSSIAYVRRELRERRVK